MIRKILRFIYYLLYQPFAWTYDWVAALVSCGSWVDSVLALLPYLPGPNVLELGHGPGHLQTALCRSGRKVVGIDASWQMGIIARKGLYKHGFDFRLVNGYAQFMCFPDRTFNQVVATFPAEYIFDPLTLHEVKRILIPDGQLVILLTAWLTGDSVCHRMTRALIPFTSPKHVGNLDRLLLPLQEAGFSASINLLETDSSRLLLIIASASGRPNPG